MKKVFEVFISVFLLVSGTLAFNSSKTSASTKYPGKKIYAKAGDILITSKKTTSFYTGHAAIVTDNLHVVEIAGPKKHPAIWSLSTWLKNYKLKNVVRLDSTSAAKKAGK
ncbi:hypothetical protein ACE38V_03390 [Cytobacillus sp. Hz8]|uniref:hypothetical protein n=1 Tax=Cytobacillus sp. Hz8 TaxID=3347168 RepID=UPI0035E20722